MTDAERRTPGTEADDWPSRLWFFEGLDQVNRAIQGTDDLEQMLRDALGAVLAVFECDRAFIVYPGVS
jgi:hypothetical protein